LERNILLPEIGEVNGEFRIELRTCAPQYFIDCVA
jgi:hypothetical protein